IPNLLFVNSNRFVPGWEGDYKRGRPANIGLTEAYSELFRDSLGASRVIDLLQWSNQEIQALTCDNLHLTKAGSDRIYDEIRERLHLDEAGGSVSAMSRVPAPKKDSILIIGNGPSTQKLIEFGLDKLPPNFDTFGMGAAYRY